MPSRKKDRGKQRKAKQKCDEEAARKAEAGRGLDEECAQTLRELKANGFFIDRGPDGSIRMHHPILVRPGASLEEFTNRVRGMRPDGEFEELIKNREVLNDTERQQLAFNYVHSYAEELREGDFEATSVIARNLSDPHLGPHLRDELLKHDISSFMLRFLSQCDKSVAAKVLMPCDDVRGSARIPFLWLDILRLIVRHDGCPDDVLLEVAKSLGPVVDGMADEKRVLFQSKIVWHMCMSPFFDLVHCIMKQSRRGFEEMIAYEGFLPFVAQASCWSVSRKDIVTEAGFFQPPDAFHRIICVGAQQIIGAVIDRQNEYENEFEGEPLVNPLEQIARAPLLSNDPGCLDSTIVGMVGLMDCDHQDYESLMKRLLDPLLLEKGYVDSRVIARIMEIGRDYANTLFVTAMMQPILGLDEDYEHIPPIDNRYAAAIRAGLLEVLARAPVHDESSELAEIYLIAKGIYAMAGHSKTSRALRERKAEILEAFYTLRKSRSGSDAICTVVEDAVDFGTPICCNCLKTFDRNVLRFCQSCMVECYCSAACQAESWDAGHSRLCGWPKWEGINATEHKRCEILRQNVMMNGCRFVRQNIGKIQLALKEEKCNAVAMSFTEHPPRFEPLHGSDEERSGGLECVFALPVHYGFAAKSGKEGIVLDKVIPQRVVAQLESNLGSEATADDL